MKSKQTTVYEIPTKATKKKHCKSQTSPLQEHKRNEALKAVKYKIRILVRTKILKCLSMTLKNKERKTIKVITYGCIVLLYRIVRLFKYTRKKLIRAFKNCTEVEVQEGIGSKRNSRERSGEMTESYKNKVQM